MLYFQYNDTRYFNFQQTKRGFLRVAHEWVGGPRATIKRMVALLQSKYEIPKIYEVKVDGHLAEKKLDRLSSGKMRIEGKKIKPCKISNVRNTEGKQWLKVQTTEVQNRIVRKMVESLGHPIDKLRRYSFGNVNLSGMVRGQYRYLNLEEIKELKKWVGL